MPSSIYMARPGANPLIESKIPLIICLENATIRKMTCRETLFTAFPMRVGMKNEKNGI